jgi:ectoine hydroxylase-related dioxygenase (phytanoyl-CoA dioxygenase family)
MSAEIDVESYRSDGYLVVRGVLNRVDLDTCRQEVDRLASSFAEDPAAHQIRVYWHSRESDSQPRVKQIEPVVDVSPVFAALAIDARVTSAAAAIFGGAATLFEDKLMAKPPGANGLPWHQDWSCCWRAHTDELVTCFVSLDDASEFNGALKVIPGSHEGRVCLPFNGTSGFAVDPHCIDQSAAVMPALDAGDMIVFSPYLLHASGPNTADAWRRTMIYTFGPARLGDLYHYDTRGGQVRWTDDTYVYDEASELKWVPQAVG